jgi:hypothetical protein
MARTPREARIATSTDRDQLRHFTQFAGVRAASRRTATHIQKKCETGLGGELHRPQRRAADRLGRSFRPLGSNPAVARGCRSVAAVAETAQRDFDATISHCARQPRARRDPNHLVRQASHAPAIGTGEVRVMTVVRLRGVPAFEAPDPIAHFGPQHDAGIGQVIQIAIQGDAVEALARQRFHQVPMAQRSGRFGQYRQHGQPRLSHSQTDRPDRSGVRLLHSDLGFRAHRRIVARAPRRRQSSAALRASLHVCQPRAQRRLRFQSSRANQRCRPRPRSSARARVRGRTGCGERFVALLR